MNDLFLGIISPVCDAYAKPGLLPVAQRIEMLVESVRDSDWIRIDTWEGNQSTWIRSKFVLDHHHEEIKKKYGPDTGLRFICGMYSKFSFLYIFIGS